MSGEAQRRKRGRSESNSHESPPRKIEKRSPERRERNERNPDNYHRSDRERGERSRPERNERDREERRGDDRRPERDRYVEGNRNKDRDDNKNTDRPEREDKRPERDDRRGDRGDNRGDRGGRGGGDRRRDDKGDNRGDRGGDRGDRGDRQGFNERSQKAPQVRDGGFVNNKFNNRKNRHEPEPDSENQRWGKPSDNEPREESVEKELPNFGASGMLNSELTHTNGVKLVYTECEDARKPTIHWRFYPIKDNTPLDPIPLHEKSCYLFGRDRKVVDIPLDHPSISKQHAVVQFRSVTLRDEVGNARKLNKPYLMDLGSTNGVLLNGSKVDSQRYIELLERDIIKFGNSSREYVLLHEGSQS